jgi:hypothetical protein
MFPICDEQGRTVGFSGRILTDEKDQPKYVNSPETPIFQKGRILFALDKAKRAIIEQTLRHRLRGTDRYDLLPRSGHRKRRRATGHGADRAARAHFETLRRGSRADVRLGGGEECATRGPERGARSIRDAARESVLWERPAW